jgi:hypothetical protein
MIFFVRIIFLPCCYSIVLMHTIVIARTCNTFLEFCEVKEDVPPRRRRLSSFLRRVATDPDLIESEQQYVHLPPPPPPPPPSAPSKRRDPLHKVFVGGLSPNTDEATLFEFMMRFGQVRNVTVKRHPITGQSRRYAYVKFFHPPSSWIFDQSWIVDDHAIRISRYEVSSQWRHHYYSDGDEE